MIAFLADVFVLEAHRGAGLGKWLVETVVRAPELQRVRRWMLGTRDAHEFYRRFGFAEPRLASSWRSSTPTPTAPDLARPWPMA